MFCYKKILKRKKNDRNKSSFCVREKIDEREDIFQKDVKIIGSEERSGKEEGKVLKQNHD